MQWSPEAEAAIKKVPFFVRKRVRQRVENEAVAAGRHGVDLADVLATQKRYLASMASEIKGYQLDTCFGPGGCPNRAVLAEDLVDRLEQVLKAADLLTFLKTHVAGELKFHHEFRITVAECPNACSQPQIKDIGIIGAVRPSITADICSQCNQCVAICPDQAIAMDASGTQPVIDDTRCMLCGKCAAACHTGTIIRDLKGYRILLGGKLGRHPQLAAELSGLYDADQVVAIVERCIALYKAKSLRGHRFADILTSHDICSLTGKETLP
jgi:anaerobic sulfite reductase subunit C